MEFSVILFVSCIVLLTLPETGISIYPNICGFGELKACFPFELFHTKINNAPFCNVFILPNNFFTIFNM